MDFLLEELAKNPKTIEVTNYNHTRNMEISGDTENWHFLVTRNGKKVCRFRLNEEESTWEVIRRNYDKEGWVVIVTHTGTWEDIIRAYLRTLNQQAYYTLFLI